MFGSPEKDEAKLREFAEVLMLAPSKPASAAAFVAEGYEAQAWLTNKIGSPLFNQIIDELRNRKGLKARYGDKDAFLAKTWERLEKVPEGDTEQYTKLGKLYAEVAGYIDRPAAAIVTTNIDQRKVIIQPADMSLEDWERKASEHQRKLIIDATAA